MNPPTYADCHSVSLPVQTIIVIRGMLPTNCHSVLGECARLVGTDDRGAAEGLHCLQLAN